MYAIEGISEIVTDITQQSNLVKTFIKEDFNKAMQGLSNSEIQEKAKLFAESNYEKRIKLLESESIKKDQRIERLVTDNSEKGKKILELESVNRQSAKDVEDLKGQICEIGNELERRIDYDEIKEENERYKISKWKTPIFIILGILMLIWCGLLMLCFVAIDWEYNYVSKIINWVSELDENRKDIAKALLYGGYSLFGICLIYCFISILLVKTEAEKKNWKKTLVHAITKKIGYE